MKWPDDEDGDVLRTLEERGFDFDKEAKIDFEIEFDRWPLPQKEIDAITQFYPDCELNDPDEEDIAEGILTGTVNLQVTSKVTYGFVSNTQKEITKNVKHYGGSANHGV